MKENIYSKIEKVVVNSGIGRLSQQANFSDKLLPELESEFAAIVGQRGATKGARISIAGFKIREGNVVGIMATLRGARMELFLKKVINIVLPRVRDFRGIDAKGVDKNGNLTIGLKEHLVFPEVSPETSKVGFGLQLTIVPKVQKRAEAMELYKEIGIPFKKTK
jgi:large subunit ribosomal protein L5